MEIIVCDKCGKRFKMFPGKVTTCLDINVCLVGVARSDTITLKRNLCKNCASDIYNEVKKFFNTKIFKLFKPDIVVENVDIFGEEIELPF